MQFNNKTHHLFCLFILITGLLTVSDVQAQKFPNVKVKDDSWQGRDFRVYAPKGKAPNQGWPVLVAFHGYGDTWKNFCWVIEKSHWARIVGTEKFILLVPDHTNKAHKSFIHLDEKNYLDMAATENEIQGIFKLVSEGLKDKGYQADTQSLYVMGFSAGAAFAGLIARQHEDKVKGTALYAGAAGGFPIEKAEGHVRVYMVCGTEDRALERVRAAHEEWMKAKREVEYVELKKVKHVFLDLNKKAKHPRLIMRFMKGEAMKK